jgi:hypothetical protein
MKAVLLTPMRRIISANPPMHRWINLLYNTTPVTATDEA